jgi:sulfite oxidase
MFSRVLVGRSVAVIGPLLAAGSYVFAAPNGANENKTAPAARLIRRPGAQKKVGERIYSRAEVNQRDGSDGRPMWVTYRDGVYDVTEFQRVHPGGHLIKQAAGSDVSPFWDIWAYHHYAPKVGSFLDKLRIGGLRDVDQVKPTESSFDPYEAEPVRDKARQTIFSERPYCSETPNATLGSSYLTPAPALYVRNHAPVPDIAWPAEIDSELSHVQKHEIAFEGSSDDAASDENASTMTISQLESRFGTTTVTSILQCAGNRASEDIAATGVSGFTGTPFEAITQGMVGNAQWTGIPLADVLPVLYPKECAAARRHGGGEWHVVFEGADGYSASSPLSRVLAKEQDCLLATKMNGKFLSPDHGFPVRALLPGVAGARNVKWLQAISLQPQPVDAPWNEYYYKNAKAEQIQGLTLQSLILSHQGSRNGGEDSSTAEIEVSGVAYSGGTGNAIARVEVSTDQGENWVGATILADEVIADGSHKHFGWVRWVAKLNVPLGKHATVSVCSRATDTDGKTQAKTPPKERGYLYNGWSKVEVKV